MCSRQYTGKYPLLPSILHSANIILHALEISDDPFSAPACCVVTFGAAGVLAFDPIALTSFANFAVVRVEFVIFDPVLGGEAFGFFLTNDLLFVVGEKDSRESPGRALRVQLNQSPNTHIFLLSNRYCFMIPLRLGQKLHLISSTPFSVKYRHLSHCQISGDWFSSSEP